MFRWLLDWFGRRDGGDAESEDRAGEGGKEGDNDGFIPSRLDASVLEAHGMGSSAAERELESIEEKAETIESNRPDEHVHDRKQ